MKVFQTLLDTVRKSNPDLITEEMANNMLQEFESGIEQIKSDALENGKAFGYREGYEEGKKVAAEQAKASLDAVLNAHDEEYANKLTQVIDMLNEQHAEKLEEVYNLLMKTYVPRQEMENALNNQDEDYANKFQDALNKLDNVRTKQLEKAVQVVNESLTRKHKKELKEIDEKHSKLLEEAVKAVDSKNAKLLQETANILKQRKQDAVKLVMEEVSSKYKKEIENIKTESANNIEKLKNELKLEKERKLNILAESVSKYLNYALEERLPMKQLISEQKCKATNKAFERIADILGVNKIVQESKDNFMAEYEEKLNKINEAHQKVINENVELTAKTNRLEAQLFLEEKTQKCAPGEAKFLKAYFKTASSPQVIEESIEEAKQAYRKMQSERHQHLVVESTKNGAVNTPSNVVTKKVEDKEQKKIINESVNNTQNSINENNQANLVDKYVKMLRGNNN